MKRGALFAAATALTTIAATTSAFATLGQPTDRGLNLQPPASRMMEQIHGFHDFVLIIIVVISLFVLALLLWVMVRYNRAANPTPRKFTHNMTVEVIWTLVPVLILVAIAARSFPLIYEQETIPEDAEITLKVTGNSWFWNLEYPDQGVSIAANLLPEEDARAEGRPYLLATTEPLLVPVDTTVRVLVTSNDVIHSFAIPALGVKEDAIQGRTNETWFRIESDMVEEGTTVLYGQCSELCGINHAYMPVEIRPVSREEFDAWLAANGGTMAFAVQPATPAAATPAAPTTEPAAPAATPTR